jgi:hypothetical protein
MIHLEVLILMNNEIISNYFVALFVWLQIKSQKTVSSNHLKAFPFLLPFSNLSEQSADVVDKVFIIFKYNPAGKRTRKVTEAMERSILI